MYNNELMHYGVLGMRWGVHRAKQLRKAGDKARAKGNAAKAKKYYAKSKKQMNNAKRLGGDALKYTQSESLGKTIVKSYLFSSYGALKYNQLRAKHVSRGSAAVVAALYGTIDALTFGVLGGAEPEINAKR